VENVLVCGSYGSVKVTENSVIRYNACEFLLAINSNYFPILNRF